MGVVFEFLKSLYVHLSVVPYLVFAAVWGISYLIWTNKKKAVQHAMDITTFFLIASVAGLAKSLLNFSFSFWFIILLMLIAFGVIGGYQYRLKGQSDIVKVLRLIWRLSFAVLAVLYVILFIIELIRYFLLVIIG